MRPVVITIFIIILLAITNNVLAKNYFIKPDGNDSANGLSHKTAWKSAKKVKKTPLKPGDGVYFLAGAKWLKQTLRVNSSGTELNPVTIGAYHLDKNGNEVIGLPDNASKPEFDGKYPNVSRAPTDKWSGLVTVAANHVIVKDIKISNSGGHGIKLNNDFKNLTIENIDTNVTFKSGISLERRTHSSIVRNSTIRECGRGWKDKIEKDWPACVAMITSSKNLIENNHVYESFGEGIGMYFDGADKNIVRNNKVSSLKQGIYIDRGKNNLVEKNIVYGHNERRYLRSTGYVGNGLGVNAEAIAFNAADATGNVFKNNLITNVNACLWIAAEKSTTGQVGAKFIGNTCVEAGKGILAYAPWDRVDLVEIKSNVFWNINGTLCQANNPGKQYNITNNHWQTQPVNSVCESADNTLGDPLLNKASGWRDLNPANMPQARFFEPQPGSPLPNAGTANSDLTQDYYGNLRSSTPAIGAIDSGNNYTVLPPTGLSVTVAPISK